MSVDLGHREPTSRGPWRPLHTPPCTGTQRVERSTPQVHVARKIWVPRGAVLPASPKDDLARRVVRLRVSFTAPCLLSWKVDQRYKVFIIFNPKSTWWNLKVATFFCLFSLMINFPTPALIQINNEIWLNRVSGSNFEANNCLVCTQAQ